jgi:cytidyltransferase-like protein
MKELARKLLSLQLQHGGIPEDIYHFLPENERKLLIERGGVFFLREKERKRLKVVLTGGAYDIIHIGHLFTLSEAKKHGDFLVVAIAKDEHIKRKGREPVHSQEYRKMMVEALKPVDVALSGFEDPKKMIDLVRPDVIVYGYDQKEFLKPKGVQIVKLERKIDDTKFKSGRILEDLGL